MQDRPTAMELLAAVRTFLEEDLVPTLDGRRRFHALVAANVLGIVERELAAEEGTLAAEWERLVVLEGASSAVRPSTLTALRDDVRARTAALADRIRAGAYEAEPLAGRVRAHVRATVVEKLRV